MSGFTNVLGSAAGGFEQARQIDQQRQFEDAQARRKQHIDILGKIAADESLDPNLRNWALQEGLNGAQTPYDKKWEPFKNMPSPPSGGGRQIQQPTQSFTPAPMPQPPAAMGVTGPPIPQMPGAGTAQYTPPTQPEYEGHIKSHAAQVEEAAQGISATTGAKAQAELGAFQQAYEKIKATHPDWTPEQVMVSLGKPLPYSMVMGNMSGERVTMTAAQARSDPEWAPFVKPDLADTDMVMAQRTRDGRPMTVTPQIVPSLIPKTTGSSTATTTPGGLTTTRSEKRTVSPQLPGSKPMPQPPTAGGGKPSSIPPAVSAAMDSIKMFGLPSGKLSPEQSLAEQQLRKQGEQPVPAGSSQARGRADSARAITPLIDKARQLIAANPGALGPLSGRWSELQKRVGNLSGPAKELAGTLTSIYSLAGSMHGWRALKVASEFEKTYGTLSSDAASLNSGLDAMANTAAVVEHIGYPGLSTPPAPPASTSGKKQAYQINGKWYDAATHQEIK